MKRLFLVLACVLACGGMALAQESEFSGGGGGGVSTAGGSGTANVLPKFSSATSLSDSFFIQGGDAANARFIFNSAAATHPMFRRNSTAVEVKLADNSAFAPLSLSTLVLNGATSGTATIAAAATTTSWTLTLPSAVPATANSLLKISGAGAGGYSLFSDDGTNVTLTSGQLLLPTGSVASPSLAASGDTNTGLSFATADQIDFSTGGATRARLNGYSLSISPVGSYASAEVVIGGDAAGGIAPGRVWFSNGGSYPFTVKGHDTPSGATDITGGDLILQPGLGSGTGAAGAIIFNTSSPGSTGSTINTAVERLRIGPTGLITSTLSDSGTNNTVDAVTLIRASSGTTAASFGIGNLIQLEDAGGTLSDAARTSTVWADATAGSEDADYKISTAIAGTITDILTLSGSGIRARAFLGAPVYTFSGDTDTGMGSQGSNVLRFYAGPSAAVSLDAYGPQFSPTLAGSISLGADNLAWLATYSRSFMAQATAGGAAGNIRTITESITLSTGGATTDSSANLLPANALILSVTARITTTIAGVDSTTVEFGDATTSSRFGTLAALTSGTTGVFLNHLKGGVATDAAGPVQVSASTLRITLSGGADNTPSGGVVRVTVVYMDTTAPTS